MNEWCKNDIYFINDIIDKGGKFYTYEEFCTKYSFRANYLDFYGILCAIPSERKIYLRLNKSNKIQSVSTHNLEKVSKYFYSDFIEKLQFTNKSEINWKNKWNITQKDILWADMCYCLSVHELTNSYLEWGVIHLGKLSIRSYMLNLKMSHNLPCLNLVVFYSFYNIISTQCIVPTQNR